VRYELNFQIQLRLISVFSAVSWFSRSVAPFQSEASPYEVCGGRTGTWTFFFPSVSVFSCHYHSAVLYTHFNLHVTFTRRENGKRARLL
jgi:hypothetical protein